LDLVTDVSNRYCIVMEYVSSLFPPWWHFDSNSPCFHRL
jgi:hypothetical protein